MLTSVTLSILNKPIKIVSFIIEFSYFFQCTLYKKELATGSLCHPLCDTKDITSLTCHSFSGSKKAVFSAEWQNTKLVFKSASTNVQALYWFDNGVLNFPTEQEFLSIVRGIVKSKLNTSVTPEVIERLSQLKPGFKENRLEDRHKEMSNLWVLLQNNEYLLAIVYTERDVFPQLLGTCGTYFAVEYLEPIPDVSSILTLSDHRDDWGGRLKTAVLILELLEELETGFKEPFHLCDIQLQHFGFAKGLSRLKYLDLKHVYPKPIISDYIAQIDYCTTDEDCEVLDCRSTCNKQKKKCARTVSNNNLQIVCEKIFLGWRMSNTVIVPGLLMSQHTPTELASILRQCADQREHPGKPRHAPDEEIKKRLYNILVEIEQTVNSDVIL